MMPTIQTLDQYRNDFGDDFYSFWVGGVFYIAVNSQDFLVPNKKSFAKEHSDWLDTQLKM